MEEAALRVGLGKGECNSPLHESDGGERAADDAVETVSGISDDHRQRHLVSYRNVPLFLKRLFPVDRVSDRADHACAQTE